MTHSHMITDATDAKRFALGGNARLTLVSTKTGARYSYRIRGKSNNDAHNDQFGIVRPGYVADVFFVSLLTGPDNEADYKYLGIINALSLTFRRTAKSCAGEQAPSYMAFAYFWGWLSERAELPVSVELWHEGRCGVCARPLTVPESIARGIGPDCAANLGL